VHEKQEKIHFGVVANRMLLYSRSAPAPQADEGEVEKFLAGEFRPVDELIGGRQKPVKLFYMSAGNGNLLLSGLNAKDAFQIEPLDSTAAEISSPIMAPAMGLALRGVKKVPMEINLLPVRLRKRPSRTVFYVLFVLICLFAISGFVWGGSRIMRQKMILNNLNGEIERLAIEIKNVDRMKETLGDLENRIDYLNNMWRDRVPLMEILKEATERIPETAWLQDFNYDKKGIQLYGYAKSASELIPLLEASPLFTDVVFLSTITKDNDGKERFRIGFKIAR
jgi:Tfp pilus assembly protein PilN